MKQRKHRSRAEWRTLIEQQKESGKTIQGFCKTHQLSTSNFQNWKSKFKKESGSFTKVDVVAPSKSYGQIRCLLANGMRLEWDHTVQADTIASLCKALS